MRVPILFAIAIAITVSASPLAAQWNQNPAVRNVVTVQDSAQRSPSMCADGNGGAFFAWEDQHIDTLRTYVYVQHLDDRAVPIWRGNGIPITNCMEDFQHKPRVCSDGAGGVIVGWQQDSGARQIFAQRINAAGQLQWGCAGVQVNRSAKINEFIGLFGDRFGGAYAVYTLNDFNQNPPVNNIYVEHIDRTGSTTWAAPTLAVSVTGNVFGQVCGADTVGNIFVGWLEFISSVVRFRVQRINSAGLRIWAPVGVAPVDTSATVGAITGDQTGGAFVMTGYSSANGLAAMTRLSPSGAILWSTRTSTSYRTNTARVVLDGKGGAIGGCGTQPAPMSSANNYLLVQRFSPAGAELWTAGGIALRDPATNIGTSAFVCDGAAGIIAAWQQGVASSHLNGAHLDSTGAAFWVGGKQVCSAPNKQIGVALVSDYPQQAICVWTDYRDTATRSDIYAAKLGDPWLAVTDTLIDFGKANVGDTVHVIKARFLSDLGAELLDVPSDALTGAGKNEFTIVNDTTNLQLLYRDARDLVVDFIPSTNGLKTADLQYTSNTRFKSSTVHFRGRGVTPNMQVTPQVDMGSVVVGGNRDSVVLRIVRSTGSGYLHVDSIQLAGTSGAYSIDSGNVAPVIVDSGNALTIKIGFHPLVKGRWIDTIFVYTNLASRGQIRLVGSGTQGALVLTKQEIDFGDVLVGTPHDSLVTGLPKNTGNAAITITATKYVTGDSSMFSIVSGGAPIPLGPGSLSDLRLQFRPQSVGPKSSQLMFVAGADTQLLEVRGNGITAPSHHPMLSLADSTVDMGNLLVGATHDSVLTAWVHNLGDTVLAVTHMSMSGANAAEFSVDDSNLAYTIDPGSSRVLTVHFAPTSAGNKSAQIVFTSNATSPPVLALTGKAHTSAGRGVLSVAANRISCGAGPVLLPLSTTIAGFVRNSGTAALTVTGMSMGGANAAEFAVTSAQTYPLNAGDSAALSIRFTPAAIGARTATLTLQTDVGDVAVVVLDGTGTSAHLAFTRSTIDFGRVPVGHAADSTFLAIVTNVGTDTADIRSAKVIGPDASAFTNISVVPTLIAPNASGTVMARFTPQRTGVHTGTLQLASTRDTVTAAVTGRGIREIHLACDNAHGHPGESVTVAVNSDSTLSGTNVRGIDLKVSYTPSQFYPTSIVAGPAASGWTFDAPSISGDSIVVHGSGTQSLAAGTHILSVIGTMLQGNVVKAPIAIASSAPSGDLDVTTMAGGQGMLTLDTICGYGTQTFSVSTAGFVLWQSAPNPAHADMRLHYRLSGAGIVRGEVRDEYGRLVMPIPASTEQSGDHDLTVDTRTLPAGVYTVVVAVDARRETRRFIVTH